jgi:hypothetical protein
MKKILLAFLLVSGSVMADQWVNPSIRSDGTYVQGHMRSSPNGTTLDNYGTRGNTNPYTGQRGTASPYPSFGSGGYSAPQAPSGYGGYNNRYGYGR